MKKITMVAVALLFAAMTVFGATNDYTGTGGTTGFPPYGSGMYLFQRTVDFSLATTTGTSGDVYQVLDIPAGTYLTGVGYLVDTDSKGYLGWTNATSTIDIGDASDTDGWIDGANVVTGQSATAYASWSTFTRNTHAYLMVTNVTPTYLKVAGTNFVNAFTVSSITNYMTATTFPTPYNMGKMYQSATPITLKLNQTCTAGKITVKAVGIAVDKE